MKKLLYVENHPHFSKAVIANFLGGFDVSLVTSVKAASQLSPFEDFSAILVDFDLNDGKGDELVRTIRACNSYTPIVACSSHEAGNAKLMEAGATEVCGKMDFSKIQAVLERLIDL